MLALNFDWAGTNNFVTYVLVLSAKVRRNELLNEWLWHTLDIGNMFGPTFGFIKVIITQVTLRNKVTKTNSVS